MTKVESVSQAISLVSNCTCGHLVTHFLKSRSANGGARELGLWHATGGAASPRPPVNDCMVIVWKINLIPCGAENQCLFLSYFQIRVTVVSLLFGDVADVAKSGS